MTIVKTVDNTTPEPYEMVTYSYVVTNTGATPLTNITVTDDNGTPANTADDFTVCTIATLAPFASQTCTAGVIPVVTTMPVVNGVVVPAGQVVVTIQANGDVKAQYIQDFGINDNTYGTGAVGWPASKIHTFGNLTGSDKLQFKFYDKAGNVVSDFYVDTISAATGTLAGTGSPWSAAYPAGYGTLGPFGGDGSWLAGNKGYLKYYSTSITESLNKPLNVPFKATLTVNSPTTDLNHDGIAEVDLTKAPGGWNPINDYTVIIDAAAFAAGGGFGKLEIPDQHNSPNKLLGPNGMVTVVVDSTVTNHASAVTASGGGLTATADETVNITVPGGACALTLTGPVFASKTVSYTITNQTLNPVILSGFQLAWPTANGKLTQINLGSNAIYTPDLNPPSVTLTQAQLQAQSTDLKRTVPGATSLVLKLTFGSNANTNMANYHGTFTFGACAIPF